MIDDYLTELQREARIEIIHPDIELGQIHHALFDFDGTRTFSPDVDK